MKISIESIKNDIYSKAENWYILLQALNFFSFALNLVVLGITFAYIGDSSYNSFFNGSISVSAFIYLLVFIFDKKYSKYRDIAEELRIIQFNKANLHVDITPEKKSYLLPNILSKCNTIYDVIIDYNTNYFENQNLKYSLLQNIYFTQESYKYHANFYEFILWFLSSLLVGILIALSYSIKFQESQIFIIQIILYFFSLITTARYYLIYKSFKNKSNALKELDAELVKTDSANENKAISLLIEYNTLLVDSYPTFNRIYEKYNKVLNVAWNERINSYSKEKLLNDFEEYIKKDITALLTISQNLTFKEYKIIGSFLDDSFVNCKSDLDILIVLENPNQISAKDFYIEIFEILNIKFQNNLVQSKPAFIIHNFGDIIIEFTPCIQMEDDKFLIVNIDNQFEVICPQKYSEYFQTCNANSSGQFYSLSKEVIGCKYREDFSISSIYLKIYLSDFILNDYSEKTLLGFLKELVKTQLKDIQNLVEPNKKLSPCTDEEKTETLDKIEKFIKKHEDGKCK